ncbi:MAG: OsmC family protein, partial [Bacteroidota bacterium]
NTGAGTVNYQSYKRDYIISVANKMDIPGSSDPAFRGDPGRYNPEDLLVSSLSACHMLWYLHLCAQAGVVVVDYFDPKCAFSLTTSSGISVHNAISPVVPVRSNPAEWLSAS